MTLEISRQILEEYWNINFHNLRPVGAELFHADSQTDKQDTRKLTDAFHNFANSPKNVWRVLFYFILF